MTLGTSSIRDVEENHFASRERTCDRAMANRFIKQGGNWHIKENCMTFGTSSIRDVDVNHFALLGEQNFMGACVTTPLTRLLLR